MRHWRSGPRLGAPWPRPAPQHQALVNPEARLPSWRVSALEEVRPRMVVVLLMTKQRQCSSTDGVCGGLRGPVR